MEPIINRIEKEYTGVLKVIRINAGKQAELVKQTGIAGVPYIILFQNGKVIAEYPGFMPYESLQSMLDKHL